MNDHLAEKHDEIVISRRIVSALLIFLLFLLFISFMIGYFLGIKHTTDDFVAQIRCETLADQLLVSASAQNIVHNSQLVPSTESEISSELLTNQSSSAVPDAPLTASSFPDTLTSYNAELIGFGTQYAAQDFIKKVHAYLDVPLELKERTSKTARGRTITWYQVVTKKYEQKNELQNILDILIKKEHLHDVKIVVYSATQKDIT